MPFLQATFDVIRHWFDAVLLETKFTKAVEEQLCFTLLKTEKCSAVKCLLFIEYTCFDIQNHISSLKTCNNSSKTRICQHGNQTAIKQSETHPAAVSSYRDSKVEMSIERSPSGPRLLATKNCWGKLDSIPKAMHAPMKCVHSQQGFQHTIRI